MISLAESIDGGGGHSASKSRIPHEIRRLGGVTLLEEGYHWEWALGFQ